MSTSSATSAARGSLEMANSNQELLRSKQTGRCSRRSLLITSGLTGGVIVVVLILIFTVGQLPDTPESDPLNNAKNGFELDDYLNGRFSYKRFNGTWVTGSKFMYRDSDGKVMLYDVSTSSSELVLSPAQSPLLSDSFLQQLSADRKFLLLGYAYEKIFRHTFLANYSVINLETKAEIPLVAPDGTQRLQLVKWSTVKNALVLVYENNIYYKATADAPDMHVLTSNGKTNLIYNGVPDWVYEEEVFGSNEALWFSSDGQKLAYATFDDTLVRTMSFPWYGEPSNFVFQYPLSVSLKYPKPGTPNPTVRLSTIDLVKATEGNAMSIPIKVPVAVGADHILATVTWSKPTEVVAVWMNRVQNLFVITASSAENGHSDEVLKRTEQSGWVELFTPPTFSDDGSKMLLLLPQTQEGSVGDFRHLTLATRTAEGTLEQKALTKGNFVVTSLIAWDQTNKIIYFQATSETDPAQQHLYSVAEDGSTTPKCLSCEVKVKPERQACSHVSSSFSGDYNYYILSCNGPDVPGVVINNKNGTMVKLWEDNQDLYTFMNQHSLPSKKRQFVDVPGGMKAYVQLWLPPDMDFSGNTKYPMLINVYGGPDSVQVNDRWVGDWGTYLSTNRSIIYGAIDGRGSGLKGNKILFSGFRRLGTVEIQDQINVTKYLQDAFPYIDKNRTAIWGWSYGGYSTGMALAQDTTGVFRCGMSVAPVTDWIYYDSIYTERYMGLPNPDDNLEGYVIANLNNKVDNIGLHPDRYLLIHGNADDNVHYQQSMILARTLELKDILFRQQSYPDEAHGLNGVNRHLYHTLENFLDECMDLPTATSTAKS